MAYIEAVSTVAGTIAGRATRLNLDEYIATTQHALTTLAGVRDTKAILTSAGRAPGHLPDRRPRDRPRGDAVAVRALVDDGRRAGAGASARVRGHRLHGTGDRVVVSLEVTRTRRTAPVRRKLDIINSAAILVAEQHAARLAPAPGRRWADEVCGDVRPHLARRPARGGTNSAWRRCGVRRGGRRGRIPVVEVGTATAWAPPPPGRAGRLSDDRCCRPCGKPCGTAKWGCSCCPAGHLRRSAQGRGARRRCDPHRCALHRDLAGRAPPRLLAEHGAEAHCVLMMSHMATPAELAEHAARAVGYGARAVGIMDSAATFCRRTSPTGSARWSRPSGRWAYR
ncbi:hypothetical protein SAZ11_56335 [Streptomyces sp. FXJ1.4098]|nr:hypothetical protein [Streptomyces sp. FXJ1.4098]